MPAMGFWEHDVIGSRTVGAVPPYVPRSVEPMIVRHKTGDVIYLKMKDILGDSVYGYCVIQVGSGIVNLPQVLRDPLPGYHHD